MRAFLASSFECARGSASGRRAAIAIAAAALAGCVPQTTYRYTALTPAAKPIPWDGRASPGGTLHLEGSATETDERIVPEAAGLHRTALYVSGFNADGAVLIEPVEGVAAGIRGSYAAYAWSHESTFGTMPLPNHPSIFGIGPEFRASIKFDRDRFFTLGIATNALHYSIPWAEYTRVGCRRAGGCPVLGGRGEYDLTRSGSEDFFVLTAGLYPSFAIGRNARYGAVFAMAVLTQGFHNDGFTNVQSSDGKIGEHSVGLLGGGYGFHAKWLAVAAGLYTPIMEDDQHVYGPGGFLTFALTPRLWVRHRTEPPLPPPTVM
jgi:hypothetical protein